MQLNIDVSTFKIHLLAVMLYFAWYLLFHSIQLPLVLPTQLSSPHPHSAWAWGWKSWITRAKLALFSEGRISDAAKADPKYHRKQLCAKMKHRLEEEGNFIAQPNAEFHTGKGPERTRRPLAAPPPLARGGVQERGNHKNCSKEDSLNVAKLSFG